MAKFPRSAVVAAIASVALLATSCGSNPGDNSNPSTASSATGLEVQPDIAAKVPAAIKGMDTVHIATDASFAPDEFVDLDGKVTGWTPELAMDVCTVLGLKCTIDNVTFANIIPGLLQEGARYQMAFSSFTPTPERIASGIDFVSYFKSGESWLAAVGGPQISTQTDMCGRRIAVQSGGTPEASAWGVMGKKPGGASIAGLVNRCAEAGKGDITVLSFDSATQAFEALKSGRADFGWDDGTVAAYAVSQAPDKIAISGEPCGVAPYGVAVAKTSGLQEALQAAIKYLIDNGSYQAILKKWHVEQGAITSDKVLINDTATSGADCGVAGS
jgi:polar amino acid transport system substrate-binding protein